jgi:hypothetical protein
MSAIETIQRPVCICSFPFLDYQQRKLILYLVYGANGLLPTLKYLKTRLEGGQFNWNSSLDILVINLRTLFCFPGVLHSVTSTLDQSTACLTSRWKLTHCTYFKRYPENIKPVFSLRSSLTTRMFCTRIVYNQWLTCFKKVSGDL